MGGIISSMTNIIFVKNALTNGFKSTNLKILRLVFIKKNYRLMQ